MANNKIQIKRSVANAVVTGLANGELAFTQASNTLWIGLPDGSGTISISGARTPGTLTANQALVANSSSAIDKVIVANLVPTSIFANGSSGTTGQVLVSNGTAVYWGTGTTGSNTQIQFNDSGVANASAGFTFDKSTNTLFVANTILTTTINVTSIGVNGSYGTVGQVLTANGSGSYWQSISANAGNGLSGGGTIGQISFDVVGSNGIISNTTGVYVNPGVGVTVNTSGVSIGQDVSITSNVTFANVVTTDLTVNGNTTLGSNTSDTVAVNALVSSNLVPTPNTTQYLGTSDLRWAHLYVQNVHSSTGSFTGDVSVGGDIFVTGNLVTTNVSSVIVSDPMIYLAGNNYTSDLVDIGFAANYYDGSQRHTGIFRDHDDGIWKIFYNLTQELEGNNDVDTSDSSYRTATLQTYLLSGALTTNTTAASLTANSTVTVSIVANTLSLSTPLAGNSGGTGLNSYTIEDILVANATNGFRKLGLGSSGYVLQSDGTSLVYDTLDGGTF